MLNSELARYARTGGWKETRSALNARPGAGAEAAVVRLTWYDDPQNAPTPGRYAAADYRVDYPNEAFACGYVVWLRQSDGRYLVVGEEEGQAPRSAERRVGKAWVSTCRPLGSPAL